MLTNFKEMYPIVEKVSIFGGLTGSELQQIYEQCDIMTAKAGEVLIREKTPATEIFIILKGRVKIVLGIDDNPLEVTEFGAGECVGETSVIGVLNHSASVVAVEDSTLLVFTRRHLTDIFHRDKNLFAFIILNIARELARRLHHTDEILQSYGGKKAAGERPQ
jgi:CRP/FNR family cyclic AMP-dependent transcriptional regulator